MFDLAWRAIVADDRMMTLPEKPTLTIVPPADGNLVARIGGRRRTTIRVSRAFAQAVHDEVTGHAPLMSSMVPGSDPASAENRRRVVRAFEDLAILFVVHHELSHLVSGHVAWCAASHESVRGFDEVSLGIAESGSAADSIPSRDARQAYFLEVEADSSGLQWLMQSRPPASLARLVSGARVPLADTTGADRVISFRMLMAVVWLVIRLTEARRDSRIVRPSPSHPRPAARLLATIATMMEQFAQLTELRADARGQLIQRLGEQQAADSRLFITEVVRPVLSADWSRPGIPLVPGSISATLPVILGDLLNLLMVRKARTPAGIELERLERLRRRMNRILAVHRYAQTRVI
jgi:hypothetical protein